MLRHDIGVKRIRGRRQNQNEAAVQVIGARLVRCIRPLRRLGRAIVPGIAIPGIRMVDVVSVGIVRTVVVVAGVGPVQISFVREC